LNLVSRFEANLLTIAGAITGQVGMDEALHLMRRELPRPACLSRVAIALLQETLAKGVVQRLSEMGWRETRHLRAGQVVSGRLWQRTPLESRQLHFSPATVEFLIWLTSVDVRQKNDTLRVTHAPTPADRIFILLALLAIGEFDQQGNWTSGMASQQIIQQDELVQLFFPNDFADVHAPTVVPLADWLAPERIWVLEALQMSLAHRWTENEESKRRTNDRPYLLKIGALQHRILSAYLDAIEAAGRYDLARFLLVAGGRLLLRPQPHREWFANLDQHGLRLADREQAYGAGLSVMREFARLARWRHDAGMVAYYDDGYAASQLFKSDWDALRGKEVSEAAADLVRHFTSLQRWETA
jgi:hypothetical protein